MQFGMTAGVNYFLIKKQLKFNNISIFSFRCQISTPWNFVVSRWIEKPAAKLLRKCQSDTNDTELSYIALWTNPSRWTKVTSFPVNVLQLAKQ